METNTIILKGYSKEFINKDLSNLIGGINLCGYFPSTFEFYDENDSLIDIVIYKDIDIYSKLGKKQSDEFFNNLNDKIEKSYFVQITIESKFNLKVIVPHKIYHVTKSVNLPSILKSGLIPKSNNEKAFHSERIYFGYNPVMVVNLADQFDEKCEYVLLEINTNFNNPVIFYDDPDFSTFACYTNNNIPPSNIKVLRKFNNF